MADITLTKKQARRFLLLKHGLLGSYKFKGKDGILDFVRQAGCIQFDPIDVCGKNAELVLQSRVKNFSKNMLYELLYTERKLLDYFDKNLAIIPLEDWKYFERVRESHRQWERSHEEVKSVHDKIIQEISERGPLSSADLDMQEKVDWYWSETRLARAALEHMYFSGELAIHHKKGNVKYYDLIENCIPKEILTAEEPHPLDFDYKKWLVLRRIGSVGLLWNRASDAWLGIPDLKSEERNRIFDALLSEEQIIKLEITDIPHALYCRVEDSLLIDLVKENPRLQKRCELIAPLDNLMWDRNLIFALFDFAYKWEIYTPQEKRKYGYYVLPILFGEQFIGRVEAVFDRKTKKLQVRNIWYEPRTRKSLQLENKVKDTLERFEQFHLRR